MQGRQRNQRACLPLARCPTCSYVPPPISAASLLHSASMTPMECSHRTLRTVPYPYRARSIQGCAIIKNSYFTLCVRSTMTHVDRHIGNALPSSFNVGVHPTVGNFLLHQRARVGGVSFQASRRAALTPLPVAGEITGPICDWVPKPSTANGPLSCMPTEAKSGQALRSPSPCR